jgi:thiol-disulfide isomerase/thioredoxin
MKRANSMLSMVFILSLAISCSSDAYSDNTKIDQDVLVTLKLKELQNNKMVNFSNIISTEKPTLVFFFSPGCHSCERQLDQLVGVNMMDYTEKYDIRAISTDGIELSHLPFHQRESYIRFYSYDESNPFPDEFIGSYGVPMNIIFNEEGNLVYTKKGIMSNYELKAAI